MPETIFRDRLGKFVLVAKRDIKPNEMIGTFVLEGFTMQGERFVEAPVFIPNDEIVAKVYVKTDGERDA